MTTQTGTVKWFDDGKGFGFITPDDVERICSLTSAKSWWHRLPQPGRKPKVQFEVKQGQKGPQASNIRSV